MRQVMLDTETTGLSWKQGHRVIEIGCVEVIDRKETGNDFHVYINPRRQVDEGALAVHGLSEEFLSDKPLFSAVVDDFVAYISGCELLIHNASFDVGFLDYELSLLRGYKTVADYCEVVDTLALARKKHVGARNSLDALCKRYDVDNSGRDLHGALLDACLLAKVYLAMTGGQTALFGGVDSEGRGGNHDSTLKLGEGIRAWDVPVYAPTAPDTQAHAEYLKRMLDSGDNACLWHELMAEEA